MSRNVLLPLLWPIVAVQLFSSTATAGLLDAHLKGTLAGELGGGYESNVFQSELNARADSFLTARGQGQLTLRPSPRNTFFFDLIGFYQSYRQFSNANQFFLDGAVDWQRRFSTAITLGLSQLLSYAELKLLDTEGVPLPRDKIAAFSYQTRLYGLYRVGHDLDFEMGGGYSRKDTRETAGFTSLDLDAIFIDMALRYYVTKASMLRVKYTGSYVGYDNLLAASAPTGFIEPGNPRLTIYRHDIHFKLLLRESSTVQFEGAAKVRYNYDRFQNQLTYLQYDWVGLIRARLPRDAVLTMAVTLRMRDYRSRASNVFVDQSTTPPVVLISPHTLEEHFLIVEASVVKSLTPMLDLFIRYQWISRQSNAVGADFENSIGVAGLRLKVSPG